MSSSCITQYSGNGRVGVAVDVGPPRGNQVEEFAPVCRVQADAAGGGDFDGVRRGLLLGEEMPDMAAVEGLMYQTRYNPVISLFVRKIMG